MKRAFFAIVLFYCLSSCQSHAVLFMVDKSKVGVTYRGTRGTIFNEHYPFVLFFLDNNWDSTKRWTPNGDDIDLAEKILKTKIKTIKHSYYKGLGPSIEKHLYSYFRQYIGLINKRGQKIIHLNCSWNRFSLRDRLVGATDSRLKFNSDYLIVMDGGSHYWEVDINLEEKTIYNFSVHGVA